LASFSQKVNGCGFQRRSKLLRSWTMV